MAKYQRISVPRSTSGITIIVVPQEAPPVVEEAPAPSVETTQEDVAKQRKMQPSNEEFARVWNKANSRTEVAETLGMKYGTVVARAFNISKHVPEITLKEMPRKKRVSKPKEMATA